MSGAVATTSQLMAAAPTPSGTIHSFFMATSYHSVLVRRSRVVSPPGRSAPRLLHLDDLDDDRVRLTAVLIWPRAQRPALADLSSPGYLIPACHPARTAISPVRMVPA